MVSDDPPIEECLKDNENIIYIPKEEDMEHIIARSLDETVKFLEEDWEVVEELDDNMFLMRKSFKPETENREL